MKYPFKKLYFVWFRFGGGATMGCYQPWLACKDLDIPAEVLSQSEFFSRINTIRDSAFFIMKERINQGIVNTLRNNNNVVVRYAGDGIESAEVSYFKNIRNLSGVIVGSNEFKRIVDSSCLDTYSCVIPANHDLFLSDTMFKKERDREFSLYFGGSRSTDGYLIQGDLGLKPEMNFSEGYFHSLRYVEKNMKSFPSSEVQSYVSNIAATGKCETLEALKLSNENPARHSCHYAVRAPFARHSTSDRYNNYDQWNTKTGGKVSTAAASGANIITSLDPSVRVLIDDNYPYSIDTTTSSFRDNHDKVCQDMLEKARSTFGTRVWQEGLEMLSLVKERTKTHNIVREYVSFINNLYEVGH